MRYAAYSYGFMAYGIRFRAFSLWFTELSSQFMAYDLALGFKLWGLGLRIL